MWNQQLVGSAIAVAGVLAFSPDGALLQLLQRWRMPEGPVLFWKFLFMFTLSAIQSAFAHCADLSSAAATLSSNAWYVGAATVLVTTSTSMWNAAFRRTSIAEGVMLYYTNPIWVVLIDAVLLRRRVRMPTIVALAAVALALVVSFMPDFVGSRAHSGTANATTSQPLIETGTRYPAATRWVGDLCALAGGIGMAGALSVAHLAKRHGVPAECMALGNVFGFLIVTLVQLAICTSSGQALLPTVPGAPPEWYFVVVGSAAGSFLLNHVAVIAPRYIAAFAVSLIFMLELVLAPLFGLAIDHQPIDNWRVAGMVLLLVTLVAHEVWVYTHPDSGDKEACDAIEGKDPEAVAVESSSGGGGAAAAKAAGGVNETKWLRSKEEHRTTAESYGTCGSV